MRQNFEGMPLYYGNDSEASGDTGHLCGLFERTYTKSGKQIRYLEGDVDKLGEDSLKVIILPIALQSDREKGEVGGTLFKVAAAEKQELLDFAIEQLPEGDDEDAAD